MSSSNIISELDIVCPLFALYFDNILFVYIPFKMELFLVSDVFLLRDGRLYIGSGKGGPLASLGLEAFMMVFGSPVADSSLSGIVLFKLITCEISLLKMSLKALTIAFMLFNSVTLF